MTSLIFSVLPTAFQRGKLIVKVWPFLSTPYAGRDMNATSCITFPDDSSATEAGHDERRNPARESCWRVA